MYHEEESVILKKGQPLFRYSEVINVLMTFNSIQYITN